MAHGRPLSHSGMRTSGDQGGGVSKASLEFHDSRLASVVVGGYEAVLELAPAYVHHWVQRGGQWIGAGWSRRVTIRVATGSIRTPYPDGPAEVVDGSIVVGRDRHQGMTPIPFAALGETTVRLDLGNAQSVEVRGSGVVIEMSADGTWVEDLPAEWAPVNDGAA